MSAFDGSFELLFGKRISLLFRTKTACTVVCPCKSVFGPDCGTELCKSCFKKQLGLVQFSSSFFLLSLGSYQLPQFVNEDFTDDV